ncbi:MAG: response regulator transcription factor [Candidatus Saccharimonadales bacterium]
MAKVMLVEDDNNLREIYEARLLAEGYDIVSAQDGEEALALAVKEKPDLIIADIMMPKISGFDMLDILRSTPETKDTKVVMMTALSQAEDKERANKLGADRYLVKSQVTLEDVARVAREVLEGKAEGGNTPGSTSSDGAATTGAASAATDTNSPSSNPPTPIAVAAAPADPTATSQTDSVAAGNPIPDPPSADPATDNKAVLADALNSVGSVATAAEPPAVTAIDGQKTAVHSKIINPINDISKDGVNLQDLVAKEEAKDAAAQEAADTAARAQASATTPIVLGKAPTDLPASQNEPLPKVIMGEIGKHEPLPDKPIVPTPGNPPAPADPNSIAL